GRRRRSPRTSQPSHHRHLVGVNLSRPNFAVRTRHACSDARRQALRWRGNQRRKARHGRALRTCVISWPNALPRPLARGARVDPFHAVHLDGNRPGSVARRTPLLGLHGPLLPPNRLHTSGSEPNARPLPGRHARTSAVTSAFAFLSSSRISSRSTRPRSVRSAPLASSRARTHSSARNSVHGIAKWRVSPNCIHQPRPPPGARSTTTDTARVTPHPLPWPCRTHTGLPR